jgi:hypothetical protein
MMHHAAAAAGHHDHDLEVPEMISLQKMKHQEMERYVDYETASLKSVAQVLRTLQIAASSVNPAPRLPTYICRAGLQEII